MGGGRDTHGWEAEVRRQAIMVIYFCAGANPPFLVMLPDATK